MVEKTTQQNLEQLKQCAEKLNNALKKIESGIAPVAENKNEMGKDIRVNEADHNQKDQMIGLKIKHLLKKMSQNQTGQFLDEFQSQFKKLIAKNLHNKLSKRLLEKSKNIGNNWKEIERKFSSQIDLLQEKYFLKY